jgi:uncharacterized membrane protein
MKKQTKSQTVLLCRAGIVAALYAGLTMAFGSLAYGPLQIRPAEALCILPLFFPETIPGLFIGCIISNLLANAVIWDIVLGSLATLIAAVLTYKLGKKHFLLAALFPVLSNTLVIPPVLAYIYNVPDAMWIIYLSLFAGEVISCYGLGYILHRVLKKHFSHINK